MKHVHDTDKSMVVPLNYYCSRRSSNWRRQTAEEQCSVMQNKDEEEDEYESVMAFLREFHNKNEEDENDRLLSRASTHATLCSIPEESSSLSEDEHCVDGYYRHGSSMKKSDTCQSFEQFVSSPDISNDFDDDDEQRQQPESSGQGHSKRPEPRRRPFSKWRFSYRSIRTTLFKQCCI